MRILSTMAIAVGALAMMATGPVGIADAASGYRSDGYRYSKSGYRYGYKYRYRNRDRDHYEAARAHNVDPAGDYKGYPDWARYALSPKYDSNRR